MSDLTIIIVSMNDAAWLRPCLRSIRDRAGELEYEIVVVENGSIAETAALLEAEFPEVRLIDSENRGFAHANNRALAVADSRYVLFLNPDTELVAGRLDELLASLDVRPGVGLAGVRHLTGGRVYPSIRRFPNAIRVLGAAVGIERSPIRPAWLSERVLEPAAYERETDCDWTVGAFMVARREALAAAGLMDERFFLYSEETDLCLRIKQGGWRVCHLPSMTILHHAGKAGLNPRMEAQNAYARMQHAGKHFRAVHRELYRLASLLGYGLRWALAGCRGDDRRRAVAAAALAATAGLGPAPFTPPPPVAVLPAQRREAGRHIELEGAA